MLDVSNAYKHPENTSTFLENPSPFPIPLYMLLRNLLLFLGWLYTSFDFNSAPFYQIQNQPFITIPIREEIAPAVTRLVKRGLAEGRKKNNCPILIDMDTYGGLLQDADSIRSMILDYPGIVSVYINKNAASAGALISLACENIFMQPGANIGAATVVNSEGKPAPEKFQSYMRGLMRSTAEVRKRDPIMAESMVGLDSQKVLTLTAEEALNKALAVGIYPTKSALLLSLKWNNQPETLILPTWMDQLYGFLRHPAVSGILILGILGGLYFEMQAPGIGLPLLVSVVCALLYFLPNWIDGLAANWEILVFVAGVICIALEVFVIPGFGIAGIAGIVLCTASLILALIGNQAFDFDIQYPEKVWTAATVVLSALLFGGVFLFVVGGSLLNKGVFKRMQLATTLGQEPFPQINEMEILIGMKGETQTDLRPEGKIWIQGKRYNAVSEMQFIPKGKTVKVVSVQGEKLFVKEVEA